VKRGNFAHKGLPDPLSPKTTPLKKLLTKKRNTKLSNTSPDPLPPSGKRRNKDARAQKMPQPPKDATKESNRNSSP